MSQWKGRVPQEMLGRTHFPRIGDLPYLVTLPPYGFFWFHLNVDPKTEPEKVLPRDITTLVVGHGWENALSSWTRRTFEAEVLPSFMPERRWFADKDSRVISAKVAAAVPVEHKDGRIAFVIVESTGRHGASRYFLPLTIRWSRYTVIDKSPAAVLAAVRRGSSEGTLVDATAEPDFITVLLGKVKAGETIGNNSQTVEFRPTSAFVDDVPPELKNISPIDREQSNTSVIVDNKYVVKVLRRVTPGDHPEFEMGRFLVDVAHFKNVPALLGTVELVEGDSRTALATVHDFIQNQGDAWGVTGASLDRLIEEQRLLPEDAAAETSEMTSMLQRMLQIGRRTAELHRALASRCDIETFAPEPISAADSERWSAGLADRVTRVFEMLESNADRLPEPTLALARRLMGQRDVILAYIAAMKDARFEGSKIRHHGDFHLGQILIAKDDAYILDFEGEPRLSLEQRRRKAPPARDVAGFLRSIDYAGSAAVERAPNVSPDERPVLAERIRSWGARLSAAFWDSYWESLADTAFWPTDHGQVRRLLDIFLLEKAFYEIEYELTNRPTWTHIPLDGAWRILRNARWCSHDRIVGRRTRDHCRPQRRPVSLSRAAYRRRPHGRACLPARCQPRCRNQQRQRARARARRSGGAVRRTGRSSRALPPARTFRRQVRGDGGSLPFSPDPVRCRSLSARRRQSPAALRQARRTPDGDGGCAGRRLRGVGAQCAARQRRRRFQFLGRTPSRHARARQRLLGDVRSRRAGGRQIQVRDHRAHRRPAVEIRSGRLWQRDAARHRFGRHRYCDGAAPEACARGDQFAQRADGDLRGPSRLLAQERPARRILAHLPRAGGTTSGVRQRDGLHPCRIAAGDGAPVRRLMGLPADRALCADEPLRHAGGFRRAGRLPSPRRPRRAARLGAGPLSRRSARACALRRHRDLRARKPDAGPPSRLEHAHLQLRTRRGDEFPPRQCAVLARSLQGGRAARRCGRFHALPRLQPARGRLDSQQVWRARERRCDRLPAANEHGSVPAIPAGDHGGGRVDGLADGVAPGRVGRAGLRLQVEHGVDARHARRPFQGSDLPPASTRQHPVRIALRVLGKFHFAALPRRGRARQALDPGPHAGRPMAALRQPARLLRLHVRPPGQEADVHGLGIRTGQRMESRRQPAMASARPAFARRGPAARARSQPPLPRSARAARARLRCGRLRMAGCRRCEQQHLCVAQKGLSRARALPRGGEFHPAGAARLPRARAVRGQMAGGLQFRCRDLRREQCRERRGGIHRCDA